jgi:hypothetical protein
VGPRNEREEIAGTGIHEKTQVNISVDHHITLRELGGWIDVGE